MRQTKLGLLLGVCALAVACTSPPEIGNFVVAEPVDRIPELGIKQQVYEAINRHYVDHLPPRVRAEALRENSERWVNMSIEEMLADIGVDPSTEYIPPERWAELVENSETEESGATVTWQRTRNDIAYVRIERFSPTTAADLQGVIGQMSPNLPRVVIMDLRGNGGGIFDACIDVTEQFLDEGDIVTLTSRTVTNTYTAEEGAQLIGVPIYILVDDETAIGAELVATALKSRGRAKIVGEPTAGQGKIRTVVPIRYRGVRSGMFVTTAVFSGPAGEEIDGTGVALDRELESGEDALTVALELIAEDAPAPFSTEDLELPFELEPSAKPSESVLPDLIGDVDPKDKIEPPASNEDAEAIDKALAPYLVDPSKGEIEFRIAPGQNVEEVVVPPADEGAKKEVPKKEERKKLKAEKPTPEKDDKPTEPESEQDGG